MTKLIFKQEIEKILNEWKRYQPQRKYPGGGGLPCKGYTQLKRYLDEYVREHHCLPVGNHHIPAGKDIFEHTVEGFDVYFPNRNFQKFHTHFEKALRALLCEYDFGDDPEKISNGLKERIQCFVSSGELDKLIGKVISNLKNLHSKA